AAFMRLPDEVREHLLGGLEVGDDAVLHGPDRRDVAGSPAEHLLGLDADGLDASVHLVQSDDRWLADDDPSAARIHAGVGGPKIDREVVREAREHGREHEKPPIRYVRVWFR